MTDRTSHSAAEREYIPGLGKDYLLPFYGVVHRFFGIGTLHDEMITLADLRAGQRVLDVGCGIGKLLGSIAKRGLDLELAGLDPDPKALARAKRRTRRPGRVVRFDRGFAQELPYPDASFDRVFASLMLHHLDSASKDQLLAEVRRVLTPDGVLVLADMVIDEHGHGHASRRHERLRDNVGDAVSTRIAAAGFHVEPTRIRRLRGKWDVAIEVARPA